MPGLHTSLNDKINSKKEGEDSSASPYGSSAASSSSSSNSQRMSADQLLNLDGVTCLPSSSGSTLWHFRCDGATYPARLVNLPCPMEVHKTHDHANYHKAADVGQMLIVYEDEYAMEEAENEKNYAIDGFPSYYHSGLTPPMRRVVQRRYLSRFEERDTKPVPPPKVDVAEVEKELQGLMTKLSSGKGKQKRTGASSSAKEKVIEVVEDEIVDYEPWMGQGGKFTVEDAKMHPEWWLSKSEMKEIDLTKKAAEEDFRRKEQEDAEAARVAEEERLKQEAKKAEKKRKKKEKKKQKQEEEALAAEAEAAKTDGKKKGIASKKNRDAPKAPAAEEIDEVTEIAMKINEGIEDEDLFFGGDDMFDFDNEDISDLLG